MISLRDQRLNAEAPSNCLGSLHSLAHNRQWSSGRLGREARLSMVNSPLLGFPSTNYQHLASSPCYWSTVPFFGCQVFRCATRPRFAWASLVGLRPGERPGGGGGGLICPRHRSTVRHASLTYGIHQMRSSTNMPEQLEESVKKARHTFVPSIRATVPHVSGTHRTPLGMDMEDGDAVAGACFAASLQSVALANARTWVAIHSIFRPHMTQR
ncbi:hypothetical protein LX36DRAFT_276523 [Colletotrichum falcatum]|nr:hypothetical protein LX36DRAFT_276523 [Colletotrichum falcatum]